MLSTPNFVPLPIRHYLNLDISKFSEIIFWTSNAMLPEFCIMVPTICSSGTTWFWLEDVDMVPPLLKLVPLTRVWEPFGITLFRQFVKQKMVDQIAKGSLLYGSPTWLVIVFIQNSHSETQTHILKLLTKLFTLQQAMLPTTCIIVI